MARKKKSMNPFKLFGSWIGAGIGFIPLILFIMHDKLGMKVFVERLTESLPIFVSFLVFFYVISTPVLVLLGFFAGYGIHLLVRKVRK